MTTKDAELFLDQLSNNSGTDDTQLLIASILLEILKTLENK